MPKRQNPFGDASPLQFKTRIGKKEMVNLGVCGQENLQSVYDKTKSMMFEAARQSTTNMTVDTSEDTAPPQPTHGQMRIDSAGKLCNTVEQPMEADIEDLSKSIKGANRLFNNNNIYPSTIPVGNGQLQLNADGGLTVKNKARCNPFQMIASRKIVCHSCRVMGSSLPSCSFCDNKTCQSCLRQCEQCQGMFCHVCSVLNYDDCMERAFCLQCSS